MDKHQIEFLARYGRRYAMLHGRLCARFAGVLTLIQVVGALSGTAAWVQSEPELAGFAGLAIAISVALALVFRPGETAARELMSKYLYDSVLVDLESDTVDRSKDRLDRIPSGETHEFEGLRRVAYNDTMIEMGYRPEEPEASQHFRRLGVNGWFWKVVA